MPFLSRDQELLDWLEKIGVPWRDQEIASVTITIKPHAVVTITVEKFAAKTLMESPIPDALSNAEFVYTEAAPDYTVNVDMRT